MTMRLRNPSGRTVKLEVLAPSDEVMTVVIGPGATVDLARYQRALDALAWAEKVDSDSSDPS